MMHNPNARRKNGGDATYQNDIPVLFHGRLSALTTMPVGTVQPVYRMYPVDCTRATQSYLHFLARPL